MPTLSSSTTASVASLGVAIKHLCSLLFSGYSFTAIEHVELANETPALAIAQCPPSDSSGGAQQAPNSATGAGKAQGCLGGSQLTETQATYPTEAKVREKNRKKALKEAGVEVQVVKRKKVIEDHHDDCGDYMSSLQGDELLVVQDKRYDSNDELSDDDHDYCLKQRMWFRPFLLMCQR